MDPMVLWCPKMASFSAVCDVASSAALDPSAQAGIGKQMRRTRAVLEVGFAGAGKDTAQKRRYIGFVRRKAIVAFGTDGNHWQIVRQWSVEQALRRDMIAISLKFRQPSAAVNAP